MTTSKLCEAAQISQQAFFKWTGQKSSASVETTEARVLELAHFVRRKYLPGSGARELHRFIGQHPELNKELIGWGKHRFEKLCLDNGMRVKKIRFVPKTTQRGEFVFPNLIAGMKINDINTVLVSDICYIFGLFGKLIGYATTLMDVYSRYLLGLCFSSDMRAENTSIQVINQGFKVRGKKALRNAVFHSDGGKQYIQTKFLKSLRRAGIRSSMADNCYENAHAEALNDTLKNHMIVDLDINSFAKLKKQEQFIKKVYNQNKSHSGIGGKTPKQFEQMIGSLPTCQRTILKIKPIYHEDRPVQDFYLRGSLGLSEQAGF